ncbi:hypothetical protein EG328_001925 [Venturia inaequalis]|nr:hypothetical protein EG328_001925 [Venturia inaequalis]
MAPSLSKIERSQACQASQGQDQDTATATATASASATASRLCEKTARTAAGSTLTAYFRLKKRLLEWSEAVCGSAVAQARKLQGQAGRWTLAAGLPGGR